MYNYYIYLYLYRCRSSCIIYSVIIFLEISIVHTICFPQSRKSSMGKDWQNTICVCSTAVSKCTFLKCLQTTSRLLTQLTFIQMQYYGLQRSHGSPIQWQIIYNIIIYFLFVKFFRLHFILLLLLFHVGLVSFCSLSLSIYSYKFTYL